MVQIITMNMNNYVPVSFNVSFNMLYFFTCSIAINIYR